MKTTTMIYPVFAFVTMTSGCCCKKECVESDVIYKIDFQNFNYAEIDTLLITNYVKGSNFITKADSFYNYGGLVGQNTSSEPKAINLSRELDVNKYDWQIKLGNTQTKYNISDFLVSKEVCTTCITGNDYYNKLTAYKINGVTQTAHSSKGGGNITITK